MTTSRRSTDAAGTTTRGTISVTIAMAISSSLEAAAAFTEPSPNTSKTMISEETEAVIVL